MRYFLSILIFISVQVNGQSWFHKAEIHWYNTEKSENSSLDFADIRFRNAINTLNGNALPYFYDKIKWDNTSDDLSLDFFNIQSSPIKINATQANIMDIDFEIHFDYSVESGQGWLQFWFIPLSYNSKNESFERINSFIIEIESKSSSQRIPETKKSTKLSSSPLSSGDWYKISVDQSGIHRINYSDLIEIGISDPKNVRIYGYGGIQLPEDASKGTQDDLKPVPVYMEKGNDGIFGNDDYILFYAVGPETWTYNSTDSLYNFNKNVFSDYGYYFITSDHGNPVIPDILPSAEGEVGYVTEDYDILQAHEKDEVNHLLSGKEWFGENFEFSDTRIYEFYLPGLRTGQDVILQTRLLSRGNDTTYYNIFTNNILIDKTPIRKTNLSDKTATFAFTSMNTYLFKSSSENLDIKLQYIKSESTDAGWLDYLVVNGRARLSLVNDILKFSDKFSLENSGLSEYIISNAKLTTKIWNISDPLEVKEIDVQSNAGTIRFKTDSATLQYFVAFNTDGEFSSPLYSGDKLGKIDNQNLHNSGSPDFVIISHPDFIEAAEVLADFRREFNNLEVMVTQPDIIYNEFSSGRPDVTALRNYLRYLYKSAGSDTELMPQYLLLFGDGSYAFKNADGEDGNFIPTYQSDNSLSPIYSYVSDDYFALLDDGESMNSGLLDIGVGRLPVTNSHEADNIVQKIIAYEDPDKMGDWRNTICFIGDDEDFNIHFSQANELSNYVEDNYSAFNVRKIFLDAYKQVSTSKGERYPDVNLAINNQINQGALIVNYTGHGGTKGLAHEQILGLNDIDSWENKDKLPLFMTATCEFSRFDDPDIVSAGEKVIMSEKGGGIALLTTTRLVYSGPNHVMNERFYEIVFEKKEDGKNYCLGEIMKYSKNNAGYGINKRNFTLLGDPAMRLTYPSEKVKTDSLNFSSVEMLTDTLRALQTVTISGHLENVKNEILDDFNGVVFPVIYDKETVQSTLGNDGGATRTFTNRDKIIYKGKATVRNGYFNFTFIIPKDINYSFGSGRVSYYAKDSLIDAAGSFSDLTIGGSSEDFVVDISGPEINVYLNNANFISGGITNENPVLYVEVYDEHGINTTGNGIGHDIIGVLDDNTQANLVLNEYYEADLDSYKSGIVEYPFFNLSEGRHSINVKLWDIYNNSSEAFTEFVVVKNKDFYLDNLLNFPNPFTDFTNISFDHNKAHTDLEIRLDIFNLKGELLKTIITEEYNSGFRSNPIRWDGINDNGRKNDQGIFLYRIRVKNSEGDEAENTGKMLFLN